MCVQISYRRLRGKDIKEVEPETIAVIFVEHTMNGELAKRLQKAEDEMARTTGFRIRVTEMAGSPVKGYGPTNSHTLSGSFPIDIRS